MDPMISVPREKLADLLRAAGSTLTPEEYVASLPVSAPPGPGPFRKFRGRAVAAAINKYCILVVAVAGVVLLPLLGFTFENIAIAAGLVIVSVVEFRVHRYFQQNDVRAPALGFRNQACFAGGILIYCLYHAFFAYQLPQEDMAMLETNNLIDPDALARFTRFFYLSVGLVAGGSQFGLAWYYKTAESK